MTKPAAGTPIGRQAHLPWLDCLARSGQAHQVGADREQRRPQLQTAFRVSQQRFVRGAHIILVDDVVTTGATLEAAATPSDKLVPPASTLSPSPNPSLAT